MRFAASLLHGLALAAINVGAVLVGFALYKISGVAYQFAVQVPAAAFLSVGGFALWYVSARRLGGEGFLLRGLAGYVWTYVLALAWLPALFVPRHYVTQGYLTSFANIYYTWLFQAPTNVAALAVASLFGRCSTT